VEASNIHNPLSIREDREYLGAIYKNADGFRFTVTPGRIGVGSVQVSLPKEDFDDVVAFWHLHGGTDPRHRYFSDVALEPSVNLDDQCISLRPEACALVSGQL